MASELIESVASSTRIEGAKLTDPEVEALLQNLEQKQFSTRDEQLHAHLLRYSDKDHRHRGTYKTLSNNVTAFDADGKELGVIFETSVPFDTSQHMAYLIGWTQQALGDK